MMGSGKAIRDDNDWLPHFPSAAQRLSIPTAHRVDQQHKHRTRAHMKRKEKKRLLSLPTCVTSRYIPTALRQLIRFVSYRGCVGGTFN